MRRLNLFAKGNVDVRDSLLYSAVAGQVQWNGLNAVLRRRFPGVTARVRHELAIRSDALLASSGTPPPALLARSLPLAPYTPAVQFSQQLFAAPSEVFVLSLQAEVLMSLVRHRREGWLFYPQGWETWPAAERRWLQEECEWLGYLSVEQSLVNLAAVCQRLRASSEAPILLYNLSAVLPGESVFCHLGLGELLSTRIRRFNLAAVELSRQYGVCLVDVDRLVAEAGAARLKIDALHLTAAGWELVAEEVATILEGLGLFE